MFGHSSPPCWSLNTNTPPHTTLREMVKLRLSTRSSKPCTNKWWTNINPTGITCYFFFLWAYWTSLNTTTGFTPFHLVHGVELVLPIECQISSLWLVMEILPDTSPLEQHLLMLKWTNEDHCSTLQMIEAAKTRLKSHFDSHVHPHTFSEGDLVLVYD